MKNTIDLSKLNINTEIRITTGEALNSDIGITGGGKGSNMLYLSGVTDQKISNDDIVNKVVKLVEERVAETNA